MQFSLKKEVNVGFFYSATYAAMPRLAITSLTCNFRFL